MLGLPILSRFVTAVAVITSLILSMASPARAVEIPAPAGEVTEAEVVSHVLRTAPELSRAEAALEEARAGLAESVTAFVPQITVAARYTRISRINNDLLIQVFSPEQQAMLEDTVPSLTDPVAQELWGASLTAQGQLGEFRFPILRNQYAVGVQFLYPVSRLLASGLPRVRASRSAVDAREASLEVVRSRLSLAARETFYALLRAQRAVEIADEASEHADALLVRVEAMERSRAATGVEVRQAAAERAMATVTKAQARAGLARAQAALGALLGLAPGATLVATGEPSTVDAEESRTVETLVELALSRRPDIVALTASVEAAERLTRAERGAGYPELVLSANIDVANPNLNYVPQVDEFRTSWDVSAVLRWSPNETVVAQQRGRRAAAQAAQARAELEQATRRVQMEVSAALAELAATGEALAASRVGVTAAEAVYNARQAQIRAGAGVVSEVTEARIALSEARLAAMNAEIGRHLGRLRLMQAIGEP